jgi:hypothetical protein
MIGTETIQTKLGSKECVHTRIVTSDFVEDDWSNSVCILKATITYTSGQQIIMEISGTNVSGIRKTNGPPRTGRFSLLFRPFIIITSSNILSQSLVFIYVLSLLC